MKESESSSITVKIIPTPVTVQISATVPVSVQVTTPIPSLKEILENKDLWNVVLHVFLLEFFGKMKLQRFFETRNIKEGGWLNRLEKLPVGQVCQMLNDLKLADQEIIKEMREVLELRNEFVHRIFISSILFDKEEAKKTIKKAEKCISVLSKL